jgi:hypothetical protein
MNLALGHCFVATVAALGMICGGSTANAGAPVAIYTFQGGSDGSQPVGSLGCCPKFADPLQTQDRLVSPTHMTQAPKPAKMAARRTLNQKPPGCSERE